MDDFWRRSDVRIRDIREERTKRSTVEIQQAVRFNLFHIREASARAEDTGVPAKGLTGQAYEGHYFWDTETYLLPFLIYTSPRIAKIMLTFRYKMLPQARARARQLGHRAAMFRWRTISGEEASAYYAAGTAQYHINADIMYGRLGLLTSLSSSSSGQAASRVVAPVVPMPVPPAADDGYGARQLDRDPRNRTAAARFELATNG
jgi:trehalose/maltose hydrolase-like predicted phosphorylase